jgi:hypothetical protein
MRLRVSGSAGPPQGLSAGATVPAAPNPPRLPKENQLACAPGDAGHVITTHRGTWRFPAALFAGPLFVLLAMAFWRYAISKYQSGGG